MTQKERDLARALKQANESIEYWESRYRSICRDVQSYFAARKNIATEAKRLQEETRNE